MIGSGGNSSSNNSNSSTYTSSLSSLQSSSTMGIKHRRNASEQFIVPEENRNVSWLEGRGTWFAYVLVIAALRILISFFPISNHSQWTLCHAVHTAAHYFTVHWRSGVPWTEVGLMQGRYDPLTFWESLDVQYDHHKRFLIVVPIVLFITTINSDSYPPSLPHLFLNFFLLLWVLLPKYYQKAANKMRGGSNGDLRKT